MIGDVNLFFTDTEDPHSAEIEIMIANAKYRGKGIGKEAVLIMMQYGIEDLKVRQKDL
jgi:RimJ/RimL family protein N-acetyltransferase